MPDQQGECAKPWKLFVGQVPKNVQEATIRSFFSPYGEIVHMNILRDRFTQISKGCGFVSYSTKEAADKAISALHSVVTIPPHTAPLQVRYADEELQQMAEHKLFIGKLPTTVTEELLRQIFAPYGNIEKLNILKGPADVNCGFVKYDNREEAEKAIRALNGKVVVRGSNEPLVVKYADTKKQKEKKMQMKFPTPLSLPLMSGGWPHQQAHAPMPTHPELGAPSRVPPGVDVNTYIGQLQAQIVALQNALTSAGVPIPWTGSYPLQPQPQSPQLPQPPQPLYHQPPPSPMSAMPPPSPLQYGIPRPMTPLSMSPLPMSPLPMSPLAPPPMSPQPVMGAAQPPAAQGEGPPGANLFIYHLPPHFGDSDLYSHFAPYGQLVSAKVFIDKATGQSKCFGFVSYSMPAAAEMAIQQMNGFQVAGKRLRVQHKRSRAQPY